MHCPSCKTTVRIVFTFTVQDFERAFHAELLLEADLEAKQREDFRKLPKWIRQYAYRAWQDRIYFDRNVTWFQQEVSQVIHCICYMSSFLGMRWPALLTIRLCSLNQPLAD